MATSTPSSTSPLSRKIAERTRAVVTFTDLLAHLASGPTHVGGGDSRGNQSLDSRLPTWPHTNANIDYRNPQEGHFSSRERAQQLAKWEAHGNRFELNAIASLRRPSCISNAAQTNGRHLQVG